MVVGTFLTVSQLLCAPFFYILHFFSASLLSVFSLATFLLVLAFRRSGPLELSLGCSVVGWLLSLFVFQWVKPRHKNIQL